MTVTTPPALPFTRQPGRIVPRGHRRWDWHSKLYLACLVPALAAEFHGIAVNSQQRHEVWAGRRSEVDYCHRTITECVTALFAFHPDTRHSRFAKTRRLALLTLLGWMTVHFFSNGEAM